MLKEFSLSKGKVIINFSAKYCDNEDKILESESFKRILLSYFETVKKRNTKYYRFLIESFIHENQEDLCDQIIGLLRLLTVLKAHEVIEVKKSYIKPLENQDEFIGFIEDLYNYWRKLERYSIIQGKNNGAGLASTSFTEANIKFTTLVSELYRKIERNVLLIDPNVYRQLPAGANVGLILSEPKWPIPSDYGILENIPFITSIVLDSPFITYPKRNTRDGLFEEAENNPLLHASLDPNHFFCYPAKIGNLLAFIFFHRDLMSHGVSLSNLFEMAREEEYIGKKPDIVYVYGAKDINQEEKTVFYDDEKNGIMLGFVSYSENIDYFGYLKKMSLTLHNLIMIKQGKLPIHGAMVNIVMKNGKSANVVIIGDSGAGKSESLEAFRGLSDEHISDMTIVFDDMGSIAIENGVPVGYGTEIGAFVRLDDLDQGYAFKEIDRSIFMNPDKTNARLVMPVATYKEITRGYPIDILLYANNYTPLSNGDKAITYFDNIENAKETFRDGKRMAKGTTTELGLVTSYFANPFGPVQKMKETDQLLDLYFEQFFKANLKVGEIKTQLGIEGLETAGPRSAAMELFEIIKNL